VKEYPELMTVEQAAEFLQCSEQQIYKLIKYGCIPANKIGRNWRISKTALIAWATTYHKPGDPKEEGL